MMLIQIAARGITKRQEFKEAKENIRKVKKDLMTMKKRAEKDIARMDKQKGTITNRIMESRKKIEKILDDMEKTTINELETTCSRRSKQMQEDINMYNERLSNLDAISGMLTESKGAKDNETCIFVGTKRANKAIQEGERILNFVRHTLSINPIKYLPDGRIDNWLKSIRVLGMFSHQQEVFAGSYLERHDVSTADEFKECDMFGSTLLSDGRLMLTDWNNKKVKLVDTAFNVVDQIIVPGHPDDICSINPEEAAVSMTMQKIVQFINLVPKMSLIRTINTEEHCRGIAYYDGHIYVVCGGFKNEGYGKLVIYTISGELVKTIETNNAGQRIFACPIAVAVVSDGKILYVTDGKRGVITLTYGNDVVSVISNKDVSWPCGICVDRSDNALICNGMSKNVIQMCNLNKIAVVLSQGIKKPRSICFDPNNLRIIMTTHRSKFVSVFQLTSPSVQQVAEGTKVKIDIVERDPKVNHTTDTKEYIPEIVSKSGDNQPQLENERMTRLDITRMSTGTELKSVVLDQSTDAVIVRSSQSKERASNQSDHKPVESTSVGRNDIPRDRSLSRSRDRAASVTTRSSQSNDRALGTNVSNQETTARKSNASSRRGSLSLSKAKLTSVTARTTQHKDDVDSNYEQESTVSTTAGKGNVNPRTVSSSRTKVKPTPKTTRSSQFTDRIDNFSDQQSTDSTTPGNGSVKSRGGFSLSSRDKLLAGDSVATNNSVKQADVSSRGRNGQMNSARTSVRRPGIPDS